MKKIEIFQNIVKKRQGLNNQEIIEKLYKLANDFQSELINKYSAEDIKCYGKIFSAIWQYSGLNDDYAGKKAIQTYSAYLKTSLIAYYDIESQNEYIFLLGSNFYEREQLLYLLKLLQDQRLKDLALKWLPNCFWDTPKAIISELERLIKETTDEKQKQELIETKAFVENHLINCNEKNREISKLILK